MARPPPEALGRMVSAALPVALLLPLVALLAGGIRSILVTPRFSTSAIFTLLVALFLGTFVAVTRRRRPRAGVLASCFALAWAPFIGLGVQSQLADGIVQVPFSQGCDSGEGGLRSIGLVVLWLFLVGGGVRLGVVLANRSTDRRIRTAAVGAVGLGLVALAFALMKIARPDPDTYLASLSLAGELRADDDRVLAGRHFHYGRDALADATPGEPTRSGSMAARAECHLAGLDQVQTFYPGFGACPPVRVRTDGRHDVAVLEVGLAGATPHHVAFRPSDGAVIGVSARTVSDWIAPPVGWTIDAGIGVLAGAALLFAAGRARRRASEGNACDATHTGDGWVELRSGERLRVDAAARLPVGDVVLDGFQARLPTYRLMGAPTFGGAAAGTMAAQRDARRDVAASLDALALTLAVLGATPLVMARLLGAF